jgi:hypothetical protein
MQSSLCRPRMHVLRAQQFEPAPMISERRSLQPPRQPLRAKLQQLCRCAMSLAVDMSVRPNPERL